MNLSGPLLLLLLTAACTVSGQRRVGSILELYNIIECVQPGVDPLKYNHYGCFCGIGGYGTPVDEVDQCCKVHDDCYGACEKIPECVPYFDMYDFNCTERQPTCSVKNNKCEAAACECDRVLALCLAKFPYNPEYQNWNRKLYCKK